MEQRNGRIDRTLQKADAVYCHYFVLPQRIEDRVLDTVVRKTATIQNELGSLSPVVEKRVAQLLSEGIIHTVSGEIISKIDLLHQKSKDAKNDEETIERELETIRQTSLAKEVEKCRQVLATSQKWLGLTNEHFRDVLSASLRILGAEELKPEDPENAYKEPLKSRWIIPALDKMKGADPSWSITLDSLRAPRDRKQKLWQWRREAPIRPVIFQDPGNLDNDAVHLHLEHKLVQRLMGRFLAQGFLHHELTRACVVLTDDAIPKVLVLGRLSLYGKQASRLHEEIITIAAEWSDHVVSGQKKLSPMNITEKDNTLQLLEDSLSTPSMTNVDDKLKDQLKSSAKRDVAELIPHLEKRAKESTDRAIRELNKRAEKEAQEMTSILTRLKEHILKTQKNIAAQTQLELEFADKKQELTQLRADQRYWVSRLNTIDYELDSEPKRIKMNYEVATTRIDPVGLVYLWPKSS